MIRDLGLAYLSAIAILATAWSGMATSDAVRAEGEIAGPDVVPVHTLATVTTSVEADGYLWFALPFETTYPAIQADPKVFQFTGTPGVHWVILIPIRGVKASGTQYRKSVTIGTAPGPNPVPPGPTPPPVPGSEVTHVTLVLDVDANDPATAAIRTSPAIRAAASSSGISWHTYDDDQAIVAARNLGPFLKQAGGIPALVAQTKDGRVVESVKCPSTEAEVVAYLKKFRSD